MIKIDSEHLGERLDSFLSKYLQTNGYEYISRSFLRANWENIVKINDVNVKPSYKLRLDDNVDINMDIVDNMCAKLEGEDKIEAEEGDLEVFFEDSSFLVLVKPKGIVVHPGIGNTHDTLANRVKWYLQSKGEYDPKVKRAGIVHRLDKPVSGLIVFAKNLSSQIYLQREFEEHRVNKVYLANVKYSKSSEIEIPEEEISLKESIESLRMNKYVCDSSWIKVEGYIKRSDRSRIKMQFKGYKTGNAKLSTSFLKPLDDTRILVMIKTGRMHQIRATLEHLGINIDGDTLYSSNKNSSMPDSISLESIHLNFKDMNGKELTFNLYEDEEEI